MVRNLTSLVGNLTSVVRYLTNRALCAVIGQFYSVAVATRVGKLALIRLLLLLQQNDERDRMNLGMLS